MDVSHSISIRKGFLTFNQWQSEYSKLLKKYPNVENFYMNNVFINSPNLTDWDLSPLLEQDLQKIYKNFCIDLETLEKIIK